MRSKYDNGSFSSRLLGVGNGGKEGTNGGNGSPLTSQFIAPGLHKFSLNSVLLHDDTTFCRRKQNAECTKATRSVSLCVCLSVNMMIQKIMDRLRSNCSVGL